MERWIGKVALVTGASSGIGKAISEKFVKAGIVVVGLARRADRLDLIEKSLANEKGSFHGIVCDVTKENDFKAKLQEITSKIGPVHILINNAGMVKSGRICEQPTESWREIFELNVFAVTMICREVTTLMREQNIAGHTVNLNSIVGHYIPRFRSDFNMGMGLYASTKFSITAITDTLRQEMDLYKTGIKVSSFSPGYTKSEIFDKEPNFSSTDSVPCMETEDAADAIMYIISTTPKVQVHELIIRPLGEDF